MATWTLYARSPQFERVGEIDTAAKLEATLRFNDVGTWVLTLATNSPSISLLPLDGSGIVLRRDGVTIMSGPITTIERGPFVTTISGVTDEIMLADRLALPVAGGVSYTDAEYDVRSSVASTMMRQYVNQNTSTGGGAQPDRQIIAISYPADPVIGNTITARARFVPLLELLQELALAGGGLRFRLAQSDETADVVYFYVEEPVAAEAATFSAELGNLDSWTDLHEGPSVNAVYAGGRGLNENRPIVESRDQASVLAYGRRVEKFVDVRETDDDAEMRQAIDSELAEGAAARVVTLTPIDTPGTTAFEDYNLGDLARAVIEGNVLYGVIRQLDLTFDKDGALVRPTIASPGASADPKAYQQTRQLTRRVARLERNGFSIPDAAIKFDMIEPFAVDSAGIENDAVTTEKILNGAVTNVKLDAAVQWLAGDIKPTARSSAQTGWLLCDGSAINRTTYASLFSAIGTTFGAGNGTTTFNIPDLRGKFPMGASGSHALGASGGSETFNNQHNHGISHNHGGAVPSTGAGNINLKPNPPAAGTNFDYPAATHPHDIPTETGDSSNSGSTAQSVLNPFVAINYEIYTGA